MIGAPRSDSQLRLLGSKLNPVMIIGSRDRDALIYRCQSQAHVLFLVHRIVMAWLQPWGCSGRKLRTAVPPLIHLHAQQQPAAGLPAQCVHPASPEHDKLSRPQPQVCFPEFITFLLASSSSSHIPHAMRCSIPRRESRGDGV